jgi:hypothetical protein
MFWLSKLPASVISPQGNVTGYRNFNRRFRHFEETGRKLETAPLSDLAAAKR